MEPTLGQIQLFPYSFGMRDWAPCKGQFVPINGNEALYSLLGTTYGGDGRTNFKLPNLIGAEPLPQMCYYIAMRGLYPTRD